VKNKVSSVGLGAVVCVLVYGWGCAAPLESDEREHVAVDVAAIVGGVKTAAFPSAALLTMQSATGATYACTATVIAPSVVLTAGHCVDAMVRWQVVANGALRTSSSAETYDWNERGATTVNPLHHDVGLVYLSSPIVLPAYPALADKGAADGTAAVDVGRILNGAITNDIYTAPITLRSGASVGFPFDYAAQGVIEHGDSGGGVFLAGTQTLVAVNSGLGARVEVLARVDLLSAWIKQKIAAHSPAPPPPAPADAGAPATDAGAPKPDAGSTPPPAPGACASAEREPNDVLGSAGALVTTACGALSTAGDTDWLTFTATAGRTVITLEPSADASATFGYVVGGKCSTVLRNVRGAAVTVASGSATLCIAVSSAGHQLQTYRIAAVR
jgi:hypothetical protein